MPHSINADEINQSIFVLQNFCFASHAFCKKYEISEYSEVEKEFTWDYYYGWLRALVSEHLLQCAIKIRVLQDVVRENDEEVNLAELEAQARGNLVLGSLHGDKNILTVREACNKIIHAVEVSLEWKPIDHEKDIHEDEATHFWSGIVKLRGKKGNSNWELSLDVEEFCIALSRFLSILEDKVDWWHAYKWNY
jgi:hypothetical protein